MLLVKGLTLHCFLTSAAAIDHHVSWQNTGWSVNGPTQVKKDSLMWPWRGLYWVSKPRGCVLHLSMACSFTASKYIALLPRDILQGYNSLCNWRGLERAVFFFFICNFSFTARIPPAIIYEYLISTCQSCPTFKSLRSCGRNRNNFI